MVDTKSKPLSIPSWQQPNNTAAESSASAPPSQSSDDNTTTPTTPRPALLEQATKFLEDESIRDASTDRKVAFLETKGLRKDEIDSLLGISRNDEATTSNSSSETTTSASDSASTATDSSNKDGSQSDSLDSASQRPQNPTSSASLPPSSSPTTTATSSPPRDVPPIITYPEFLVKQSKPPPLVSFNSILYTLYGAAGLGASIYGASEYLVKPMLANLTSARHDFAQSTKANLRTLNEKLEQNVSTIPPELSSNASKETGDNADEGDADSITSDPTELFHRDVATQTSAQDVAPKEKSTDDAETPSPTAAVDSHQKRLETITSHLREFANAENDSTACDDTVRSSLRDVHYYLDGLIYSNPSYGPVSGYGSWNSSGISDSNGKSTGVEKAEEDAIASFKSEIRGVKGALLSAKNFPSSRGRVNR